MSSPYVTFSTIYRVEVRVPNEVFDAFGHTAEYSSVASHAASNVECSGQDSYSEVFEWGEAPTRLQCESFANHWHNWILQWQERLRA